jgi:1A family penicillin-binding protein
MFYVLVYYLKKFLRLLSEPFFFIAYVTIQATSFIGQAILQVILTPYYLVTIIWTIVRNMAKEASKIRISLPKPPQIQMPQPALPQVRLSLPKLSLPQLKLPRISLPSVSLPKLRIPRLCLYRFTYAIRTFVNGILWVLNKNNIFLGIWRGLKATGRFVVFHRIISIYVVVATLFVVAGVVVWQSYIFVKALPSPRNIGKMNFPTSTHIYDRNGELLYEIYRDQNRTPVSLNDLPDYVSQATIAIEDKDFYHHYGISLFGGMVRAIKDTYLTGELQGGSTITQQLVKSSLLTPERTIERKIKEVILAVWTERLYTKNQILEMYLNQVPYGGSAYGIEEAANTFFGKPAKELKLEEAALLAGLPQAPSLYSPYLNPDLAKKRRNEVLRRMRDEQFITPEQYETATKKELAIVPLTIDIKAPHFVFYIKQKLEEKYGVQMVEEGGLRVTTTLDLKIQQQAEQILKEEIEKVKYANITNGAILVTDPASGEILAMVGSVDYFQQPNGAFNVTDALRQPGSTIKPVMYSLALENGYTAATLIDDVPTRIDIPGSEPYVPVNYDGRFHGRVTMRDSLANSYNIPAVKVLQSIGVDRFLNHAEKMGIDTWTDRTRYGLSITLGGGEVRMTDMAEAFGVFASGGYLNEVNGIKSIETRNANLEFEKEEPKLVMNSGIAYIISDILSDNVARQSAFGSGSLLEIPNHRVAVKTGTTNDLKDNWTIGYTPEYLVAVWVGNNDNTPMNQYLVSGVTGAAPIWHRVMEYLLNQDKEYNTVQGWYEKPANVIEQQCYGKTELFIAGTEYMAGCGKPFVITPRAPLN